MKKIMYVFAISAFTMMFASCGKKAETDSKEFAEEQNEERFDSTSVEDDTEFAVNAADAGMLEVQLGQLAMANGATPEIKQLGKTMVDEHTRSNDELKTLAMHKNISLPSVLSEESQKHYEDLAKKSGLDFDKEYAEMMVKGHKDVIDEFKEQAERGNDPDLKTWALEKLPVLEQHLSLSETAQSSVKEKK